MAKVLLFPDERLVRQIDRVADSRGLSRSAYLRELAERDIARHQGPGSGSAARRALARLDELLMNSTPGESTALIRAERDAR